MQTGLVETWGENPAEIGPLYPFVGSEEWLFLICFLMWFLYTLWQMKFEYSNYTKESDSLNSGSNLVQTIEKNGKVL